MYFFGVRLDAVGFYRKGALPVMEFIQLGVSYQHDLQAQRQLLEQISDRAFFADKSFVDKELEEIFLSSKGELITLVKYKKGQLLIDKQRHKAADDLYSKAVSTIRQPIESFFNWLIEHTDMQNASKVRPLNGLLVHVFG